MTRQKAISLKCKDCIYDPKAPGTWVAQVAGCIDLGCPLHPYRPLPRKLKLAAVQQSELIQEDEDNAM